MGGNAGNTQGFRRLLNGHTSEIAKCNQPGFNRIHLFKTVKGIDPKGNEVERKADLDATRTSAEERE
jgi:heme-degrading monooxygenase HmoA